ncbi:hypothetical protein ASPBRDRAFT_665854 [Aspergillus brasiliensis CBS 101740]|uniref:Uncharacterized protein n=1 Tax=Aspergillus brasiliensis (strain CBS 101740 / IMI 381727 / IBT 21946) TaxID=767769 RepID=A0A1L9U3S0_ASPBC|nr:hypothetical protein ASPBRDRAFT_665854 [Aspergillus brasiliensis CBS 101740]
MSMDSADRRALRDKSLHFRGRARVSLDRLHYYGISMRGNVDEKHINHLVNVFQAEGCTRLHDPNHYVPVIISPEDLEGALAYSNLRGLDLMQDRIPYFLDIQEGTHIRVLHGEHRLRAAEKFLEPTERWWTVVLYTTGLSKASQETIREEYSHELKFSDGDIYRSIRSCQLANNQDQVEKWKVRLSSKKLDNFELLGTGPFKSLQNAFDESIPFIGLWDAFLLGSFNRIFPMRCPEVCIPSPELEHYVRHINRTWMFICGDHNLFNLVDGHTVKQLETLAPEATSDRHTIQDLAQHGEIFSAIDRLVLLQDILPRILQVQGRIPSFRTFFEDTIYMETLIKSLRPLLPTPQPRVRRDAKPTFRQSYYRCFTDVGQSPDIVKVHTGEGSFRPVSGSVIQRKELGYLMMFLAAMRDFPVLSQTAPHRSQGEKKPIVEGSIKERQSYLALLALNLGFDSPQIQTLARDDPDLAAARAFIRQCRPSDQYELNTIRAEALARHIAIEIRAIASPINRAGTPPFFCSNRVPKKLRYGLPDNNSHKKDRKYLFLDTIYEYSPPFGQHLTTLAFQRDIFVCFFGTPPVPSELSWPETHDGSGDEDENIPFHVISGSLSEPVSDFSGYLRTIESAIWSHSRVPSNIANEGLIVPVAPGFEHTVIREMNMFHTLDDNVRPSEAVTRFLSRPTVPVMYIWNERKYIKFWPTERRIFEDIACTLADCNMCFAVVQGNEFVVAGLADLWAKALSVKLILAGPKSTRPQSHDVAKPLDIFLQVIDD